MCKRIAFLTCKLYLHFYIVYAYDNVICPSDKLWTLRARSFCQSVQQYTCLIDSVKHIYKESCNGPRTEPPGDKTVVNSGNFDTKPCPPHRFQPFSFSSSQGNDCIFRKSICSDVGQVRHSNGTRRNDRECRCDYTRNFIFLSTSRKKRCSCDPTTEDCSCFMKPCGQGEILSQDYQCIKKEDFYGRFVCEEINMRNSQPTDSPRREVNRSDKSGQITIEKDVWIAAISSSTLTGILILVLILLFLIPDKILKISSICKKKTAADLLEVNPSSLVTNDIETHRARINNDAIEVITSPSTSCINVSNVTGFDKDKTRSASQLNENSLTDVNLENTSETSVGRHLTDFAENDLHKERIAVDNSEENTRTVSADIKSSETRKDNHLIDLSKKTDDNSLNEPSITMITDNSEVIPGTVVNHLESPKENQPEEPTTTSFVYPDEDSILSAPEQKTNSLNGVNREATFIPPVESISSDVSPRTDDDSVNEQIISDSLEVNPGTVIGCLKSSDTPKGNQLEEFERKRYVYEISENSLEFWKEDPVTYKALIDLIQRGVLKTYKSQERTTELNTKERPEEAEQKLICQIQAQGTLVDKMKTMFAESCRWVNGTFQYFNQPQD